MRTIKYLFAVCMLLALLTSGCAKEEKVYRIGILSCLELFTQAVDGFKEEMAGLGYIEGENLIYDIHILPVEDDKEMQVVLEQFVQDRVDLIVALPTRAALKAKEVTIGTGIPVIFASAYTEGNDLIESVRKPGGNITGVRWPSSAELGVKRLELLHEMVPQVQRVWIAYDKDYSSAVSRVEALREMIDSLDLTLVEIPVSSIAEIEADLEARKNMDDIGIDAMMMTPLTFAGYKDLGIIPEFADEYKIPIVGHRIECCIFRLSSHVKKSGQQSVFLADKVLKGTPAGTIPVITAETYFQINYKKIQEIGLEVSEGVLARADEIIH